ncbi:hypothetical protein JOB18_022708 [Solea senegalensis]|uniref:Uncharacterized protein n=1 Tax=Solea senegalensis TaxID=28829 RepID=A0AAV6T715_SOLSE|nr:hypothetical protein JOB18_022708 [Solea senegalensis]
MRGFLSILLSNQRSKYTRTLLHYTSNQRQSLSLVVADTEAGDQFESFPLNAKRKLFMKITSASKFGGQH